MTYEINEVYGVVKVKRIRSLLRRLLNREGKNFLKVILMTIGKNEHYLFSYEPNNRMNKIKIHDFEYDISPNDVYLFKPALFTKLWFKSKFKIIKHIFIVFYKKDEVAPLGLISAPKAKVDVDSRTLCIALLTRQYKKGLNALWQKNLFGSFSLRKVLLIGIIIAIVGGVIYAYSTGMFKGVI